jgi:hypothetical protein
VCGEGCVEGCDTGVGRSNGFFRRLEFQVSNYNSQEFRVSNVNSQCEFHVR